MAKGTVMRISDLVDPLTDDELADIKAMTPVDSHPIILRLLATIEVQQDELERLRIKPLVPNGKAITEAATEDSGCYARCGRIIEKGEERVRYKPPARTGSAVLFHKACFEDWRP